MFCIMQTADWWNYFWYCTFILANLDYDTDYEAVANKWHLGFYWAFSVSMACFLIASFLVSYVLVIGI